MQKDQDPIDDLPQAYPPTEGSETRIIPSNPATEGIYLGNRSSELPDLPPLSEAEQKRKALSRRFMTAAGSPPPTAAQKAAVASNQFAVLQAATAIVSGSEEGREQALALTKLEEALMWANKAVFRA